MEKLNELQEAEDKEKLAELRYRNAERVFQQQQQREIAKQKAVENYHATLDKLKIEAVNAVMAGDTGKARALEGEIRALIDAGAPELPQSQVEAQRATDESLKAEYATLTRTIPSSADQALQIKNRMSEIEQILRSNRIQSVKGTLFVSR